jgi:hypothetical protein
MDEGEPVREAFSVLAHDIRLDILLALFEDWEGEHTDPRGYAELMRAVGVEDSGKFNYHLSELRGAYVRKVEDGYVPTAAATALYRAALAHRPAVADESVAIDADAPCPSCGSPLEITHRRGFLSVRCADCASPAARHTYPFPRNGLDGRSDTAVLDAFHRRLRAHLGLARLGTCPFCAGRTERELRPDGDGPAVRIACLSCTFIVGIAPLPAVLDDDRVAGALREAGTPVEETYHWDLPKGSLAPRGENPREFTISVDVEGGLHVDVDDALRVIDCD